MLTKRLEERLADHVLEAVAPLVEAGKLSSFLLQLSPAFGPRDHKWRELAPLVEALAPHPVAIEPRNRSWNVEEALSWMEAHGAVWVSTDSPPGDHFTIMPPVDAVTRPGLAYLHAHGRNIEGYVRGRTVADRFAWRYADEELEEIRSRAEELAEQAGDVRLMFNNNRGSDAPEAAARMGELLGAATAAR